MAAKKRLHPERVLMMLILLSGIVTYTLFGIGFFFDKPWLYPWAAWALATTIAVASIPMLGYLLCLVIERIRRDRRNHD